MKILWAMGIFAVVAVVFMAGFWAGENSELKRQLKAREEKELELAHIIADTIKKP